MIQTRTAGAVVILDLHGGLAAGPEDSALRRAIRLAFEGGARTVILNMQDVAGIDSSGVAALASGHMTAANAGGHLKLCNVSKKLSDVFTVMRLHKVFESYATEADAVASADISNT